MEAKPIVIGLVLGIIVLAGLVGLWAIGTYNDLVAKGQAVDSQWANVQSVYQRRADLIPNLVSTVKGYMKYEAGLLENITALRSQWGSAASTEQKIAAGTAMDSAISRLLLVYENYPELKANENVAQLMDELAGSENRISVERMRYNGAARDYNTALKLFPASAVASFAGFREKPYFEAQAGAEDAPKVNLG